MMGLFIQHEDNDVTDEVLPFTQLYITYLKEQKKLGTFGSESRQRTRHILSSCVDKMRFPAAYNFERENEDEETFNLFRKNLQTLLQHITTLDVDLVMEYAHTFVSQTLECARDPLVIELALHLVYLLPNVLPGSYNATPNKETPLASIFSIVLYSNAVLYNHRAVKLTYFNVCSKYEKYLLTRGALVPQVLTAFLNECGIRNECPSVRSRACYLFLSFVKCLREQLQPFLNDILQSVLALQHLDLDENKYLLFDDQTNLFEAAAILITANTANEPLRLFQALGEPLKLRFQSILSQEIFQASQDIRTQQKYADLLAHIMHCYIALSKSITSPLHLEATLCFPFFAEALELFTSALSLSVGGSVIRDGLRTYVHRMMVIMGSALIPELPRVFAILIGDRCEVTDLSDSIQLIDHLIDRFKSVIKPVVEEGFFLIVQSVFAVLSRPVDPADTNARSQIFDLKKVFFKFLSDIITFDFITVLLSVKNVEFLNPIFQLILQGASEMHDAKAQKFCFQFLNKFLRYVVEQSVEINGFADLVLSHLMPGCISIICDVQFNPDDAQVTLLIPCACDPLHTLCVRPS